MRLLRLWIKLLSLSIHIRYHAGMSNHQSSVPVSNEHDDGESDENDEDQSCDEHGDDFANFSTNFVPSPRTHPVVQRIHHHSTVITHTFARCLVPHCAGVTVNIVPECKKKYQDCILSYIVSHSPGNFFSSDVKIS